MTMLGQQQHTDNISPWRIFSFAFIIFIAIQYPISAPALTTLSYYLLLLPSLFFLLYREKNASLSQLYRSRTMQSFSVLFAYILVHTLAFSDVHEGTIKTLKYTAVTYLFFVATAIFFIHSTQAQLTRLSRNFGYLGAISAVISIGLFYTGGQQNNPRLVPIGRAEHEIMGSFVYAICGLCALHAVFQPSGLKYRISSFIAVFIIGVMITLTQSRMAMGSYLLCVGIGTWGMLLRHHSCKKLLLFSLFPTVLVALIIAFIPALQQTLLHYVDSLLLRGDSFRIALWALTIQGIEAHPWIGNGMRAYIRHPQANAPHNIYLATAFHIGIPGLVLFIIALANVIKTLVSALKARLSSHIPLLALLLLNGLLSGITEYGQMVKSPNPLWLIFWFPIAAIIGVSVKARIDTKASNTTCPDSHLP